MDELRSFNTGVSISLDSTQDADFDKIPCSHSTIRHFDQAKFPHAYYFKTYFPPSWLNTWLPPTVQPGVDLLTSLSTSEYHNYTLTNRSAISFMRCEHSVNDITWLTDRAGPFISTGGYDYWALSWTEVFGLQPCNGIRCQDHYVTGSFTGAIDAHGHVIGLPPLHMHHSKVTQCKHPSRCGYFPGHWYAGTDDGLILGVPGDAQCTSCGAYLGYGESYPNAPYLVSAPIAVNALINDVRPKESVPITWHYQVSLRFVAQTNMSAQYRSTLVVAGTGYAGLYLVPGVDSCTFHTFHLPSSVPDILRMRIHVHVDHFGGALLISALPSALGLPHEASPALVEDQVTHAMPTTALGYISNMALRSEVVQRYATIKRENPSIIMCEAFRKVDTISGADRRADVHCDNKRVPTGVVCVIWFWSHTAPGTTYRDSFFPEHSYWNIHHTSREASVLIVKCLPAAINQIWETNARLAFPYIAHIIIISALFSFFRVSRDYSLLV